MLSRVLIVEDSALQAMMYRAALAPFPGCLLSTARDGLEALDMLALRAQPDLIILDINMPRMDGLAFLEAMNRAGRGAIPVIVISTEGKEADIVRALRIGARAYLVKPWKPADIQAVIRKVLPDA